MRRGVDTSFLVALEFGAHPHHQKVRRCHDSNLEAADTLVVSLAVLSEFVHITTDAKRFADPLPMAEALRRAREIWEDDSTEQLRADTIAADLFFEWMLKFRLGRKRILDTQLAANFHVAEVVSLLTLNPADFRIFNCFEFHPLLA